MRGSREGGVIVYIVKFSQRCLGTPLVNTIILRTGHPPPLEIFLDPRKILLWFECKKETTIEIHFIQIWITVAIKSYLTTYITCKLETAENSKGL